MAWITEEEALAFPAGTAVPSYVTQGCMYEHIEDLCGDSISSIPSLFWDLCDHLGSVPNYVACRCMNDQYALPADISLFWETGVLCWLCVGTTHLFTRARPAYLINYVPNSQGYHHFSRQHLAHYRLNASKGDQ